MLQRSSQRAGAGRLASGARLAIVAGAALAAAASGSSRQSAQPTSASYQAPPPRASMAPQNAVGLWKSSFGPVKIQVDDRRGNRYLMGVWVYDRAGQEVIGYFSGRLDGNVLQFRWHEPADPEALVGSGYLVFDPQGASFNGRWWTESRDRSGDWSGWRQRDRRATDRGGYGGRGYGGRGYGNQGDPPGPPPPPRRY